MSLRRVSFCDDPPAAEAAVPHACPLTTSTTQHVNVDFGLLRACKIYQTEALCFEGQAPEIQQSSDNALYAAVQTQGASGGSVVARLVADKVGPYEDSFVLRFGQPGGAVRSVTCAVTATVIPWTKGVPMIRSSVTCIGHCDKDVTDADSDMQMD